MQKATYFETVVKNLEEDSYANLEKRSTICFSTLKILEYWVRILSQNPESVNRQVAFRLMNEKALREMSEQVSQLFSKVSVEDDFDPEPTSARRRHMLRCRMHIAEAVNDYKKHKKSRYSLTKLLRALANMDSDDVSPELFQEIVKVIAANFREYAINTLKEGISEDDISLCRVKKTKEMFRLNDKELELLLYLWLRGSNDLEINSEDQIQLRPRRFRDNDANNGSLQNISRATGLSMEDLDQLLSKDSALCKLQLIDSDLDVLCDVHHYLSGYSDEAGMKSFNIAKEGSVPFKQLAENNPEASLALDIIKNHDRKHPLNMLFYGTEGTGKTELAKAIAKELGMPLYEISISADDEELFGRGPDRRDTRLVQYRLRAITLADWQCEHAPGIIMVDEADLVLNGAEKGSLNHFFESINNPILWITNNMTFVEPSTRRRFDYSMHFKPLAKDERLSVLNSVLKAQNAQDLLTEQEKLMTVVEYPAMAGGLTLAVQRTKALLAAGVTDNAYKTIGKLLKAHTHLLNISNGSLKEIETHAPSYSLEGLNIQGSMEETLEVVNQFDAIWKTLDEDSAPRSLNMLLYGPPGTGKTEFVRYLARHLGRNLIIKRASDLLGKYVGENEAKIRAAFEEADRTKSILFFDEADSFLQDRSFATQEWQITKVNELLTQMENFKGIFIAATNFDKNLDQASRRRFALKLGFDYLKPEGAKHIWNAFFPNIECPESVCNLPLLTPGDFNAVNGRLQYLPASLKTPERIFQELKSEINAKDSRAGRTMGF